MKPEDKQLLLQDLCARLPYGVYVKDINKDIKVCKIHEMKPSNTYCLTLIPISDSYHYQVYSCDIDSVRPYLRPMSNMTEEEKKVYNDLLLNTQVSEIYFPDCEDMIPVFDWLNKNMFDYRGLIPKDLAISTEVFNPYKD